MTVPTQIGIHAPYTWGETTYMALTLAELATRFGLQVSMLPTNVHNNPVHLRWDQHVLSRHSDFRIWAHSCSHVVWFDVQPNKLQDTPHCKHILVLLWHHLRPADLKVLPRYDYVVCPHARAMEALKPIVPGNYVVAPWDPGSPLADTPQRYGGHRLLVVLDPYTTENMGHFLLHSLHSLLDALPELQLTLWHDKRWTTAGHQALGELLEKHGTRRIYVMRKASNVQRSQIYATHDWVFYPSLRDNTSLPLLEGLYAARPGIAFGSLPQTEVITQGHNGMLIPCENHETPIGSHQVQVNRHMLTEELHKILADETIYTTLTQKEWPELVARRYQFQQTWKKVWNCT